MCERKVRTIKEMYIYRHFNLNLFFLRSFACGTKQRILLFHGNLKKKNEKQRKAINKHLPEFYYKKKTKTKQNTINMKMNFSF